MENKRELKEKLNNLINKKAFVVGVEQGQKKLELVNIWEDEQNNVCQLLGLLYQKAILKSYNLKVRYSYNYSDTQTINFIQKYENYDGTTTTTKYIFYNVPTSLGFLDTFKIRKEVLKIED